MIEFTKRHKLQTTTNLKIIREREWGGGGRDEQCNNR
jgi:hypothetical protein